MSVTIEDSAPVTPRRPTRLRLARVALPLISILAGLAVWKIGSGMTSPLFLPSPTMVWSAAVTMAQDGSLAASVGASAWRIFAGWAAGVLLGIPLGLFMGRFAVVRALADPYIEFFRFIPPIAFVTLAVIWMGPGEITKIALIFYTTIFIVTLNTIAGVEAVNPLRLQAARSLGANKLQEMTTIILPSTVPYMVTGARIAMGNSFLTVVSAEIVSAQQGLGALIWTARNFARTDWVFVGIISLGCLGFLFDRIFRYLTARLLKRFL